MEEDLCDKFQRRFIQTSALRGAPASARASVDASAFKTTRKAGTIWSSTARGVVDGDIGVGILLLVLAIKVLPFLLVVVAVLVVIVVVFSSKSSNQASFSAMLVVLSERNDGNFNSYLGSTCAKLVVVVLSLLFVASLPRLLLLPLSLFGSVRNRENTDDLRRRPSSSCCCFGS